MEEYEKIEDSIDLFIHDFNNQVSYIADNKDFHSSIIRLSSQYPEHKEILEFVVLINDKLETRQSLFSDMVSDSCIEMARIKKMLLSTLILKEKELKEKEELIKNKSGFINTLKGLSFKDYKFILILIAVIAGSILLMISPDIIGQIAQLMK